MSPDYRGRLLVACLPALRAYVRRIAGAHQSPADLLQEVSLRILSGEGPQDPDDFLAWCCGVARHVLAYEWRRRKRTRTLLQLDGEWVDEISSTQGDPDNQVDARAWLARAAVQIDSKGMDLLIRRYVLEETGAELADNLGQTSAALRMRLMRLRGALHEQAPKQAVMLRR